MMRSKSSHHYSHRLFKRMELIAISHTGWGILPENMNRIFDPFLRPSRLAVAPPSDYRSHMAL